MSLTSDELDLLRRSLRQIAKVQPAATGMFYDRLFEVAPETRALFTGDMQQQGIKMMSTLGSIVAQLHSHAALAPMAAELAIRHVAYGVVPQHYAVVGSALIWTLRHGLGEHCSPEVEAAWCKAYDELTAVMIDSAYGPAADRTRPP